MVGAFTSLNLKTKKEDGKPSITKYAENQSIDSSYNCKIKDVDSPNNDYDPNTTTSTSGGTIASNNDNLLEIKKTRQDALIQQFRDTVCPSWVKNQQKEENVMIISKTNLHNSKLETAVDGALKTSKTHSKRVTFDFSHDDDDYSLSSHPVTRLPQSSVRDQSFSHQKTILNSSNPLKPSFTPHSVHTEVSSMNNHTTSVSSHLSYPSHQDNKSPIVVKDTDPIMQRRNLKNSKQQSHEFSTKTAIFYTEKLGLTLAQVRFVFI